MRLVISLPFLFCALVFFFFFLFRCFVSLLPFSVLAAIPVFRRRPFLSPLIYQ